MMSEMWMCYLAMFLAVGPCPVSTETVYEMIDSLPELSKMKSWLPDTIIAELNDTAHEWTVFFADNAAVDAFMQTNPDMENNAAVLGKIVMFSIVNANMTIEAFSGTYSAHTDPEVQLYFYPQGSERFVNNAKVTEPNKMATNGFVNVVDRVLYPVSLDTSPPDSISSVPKYSRMNALLDKVDSVKTKLGDGDIYTVFCPQNDAISDEIVAMNATELEPLLKTHIVQNPIFTRWEAMRNTEVDSVETGQKINTKTVDNQVYVGVNGYWAVVDESMSNQGVYNGTLHVINAVLGKTTGVNLYQLLSLTHENKGTKAKADTIESLKLDLVKDDKAFTILSPPMTAWDAINKDTDIKKLVERHVIASRLTETQLRAESQVTTLGGDPLSVRVKDGKVTLTYGDVETVLGTSDQMATNGLIHSVDKVLSGGVRTAVSYAVLVVALFCTLLCI